MLVLEILSISCHNIEETKTGFAIFSGYGGWGGREDFENLSIIAHLCFAQRKIDRAGSFFQLYIAVNILEHAKAQRDALLYVLLFWINS